jgi:RNA polymerase sigma-70 factor, ECF subfamily
MVDVAQRLHLPTAVVADDATLVAQARAGEEHAFATLYRRHARYVAGIVYRLLGNDSEVDDVMQEAFCDAAGALRGLQDPGEFRAWIARIAVRRVHKRIGRKRRWQWLRGAMEEVTPTTSDPRTRQRVHEVYDALLTLPGKLRVPWILHIIEGETLPSVARLCDISLATAKRRIADAGGRIDRRLHGAHGV